MNVYRAAKQPVWIQVKNIIFQVLTDLSNDDTNNNAFNGLMHWFFSLSKVQPDNRRTTVRKMIKFHTTKLHMWRLCRHIVLSVHGVWVCATTHLFYFYTPKAIQNVVSRCQAFTVRISCLHTFNENINSAKTLTRVWLISLKYFIYRKICMEEKFKTMPCQYIYMGM